MIGDPGPYIDDEGNVWVPRTVPWSKARGVASEADQEYGQRLRYVGKSDGELLGFTRDCDCDEVCELRYRDDEPTVDTTCTVPVWHFVIENRP